jgi:hypothetical protein
MGLINIKLVDRVVEAEE